MSKGATKIHLINILLMAVSLVLAMLIPFELFLTVYAVLGPLHYLTELNWLNEKDFFLKHRSSLWPIVGLTLAACIPVVLKGIAPNLFDAYPLFLYWRQAYTVLILIIFLISVYLSFRPKPTAVAGLLALLSASFILLKITRLDYLIGFFLPTLIHVYFFTLIFMTYSVIKNYNQAGIFEVISLIAIPILISLLPVELLSRYPDGGVISTFKQSAFNSLNWNLGLILNLTDRKDLPSFPYTSAGIRIQVFIAFAYLYHYLNWFSKVSLIGWLTNVSTKKRLSLIITWLILTSIYLFDYRVGLIALFTLSLFHVTMEFPLNILTTKGVILHLLTQLRLTRTKAN